jgi:hypothetical protein
VTGALAAVELVFELFELLPQPASSADAVSNEIRNFGQVRKMSLLCRELLGSSSSSDLKMPPVSVSFPSSRVLASRPGARQAATGNVDVFRHKVPMR